MFIERTEGINPRLCQVRESATIEIADRVNAIERSGQRVIRLQTGDPDFATPPEIIDAAHRAMKDGFTHYATSRGLIELRRALAEKLARDNNIQADPDTELLVTHGAAHAIFITMQTLLKPGDEVLFIEPFYKSYASSATIAGGVPVMVKTDPAQGFVVDIADVQTLITSRSRMLVLNSPCNPSGVVLPRTQIEALARIVAEHDMYVLCDDVYEKLLYDDAQHVSVAALPGMRERTITINSFSKTYAMSGWRLGYLTAPEEIVAHMLKVLQYSATNIAAFSQKAAVAALTSPEVSAYVETMRQKYDHRRLAGLEAVARIEGLRALKPQGAFYLMLDISGFCQDSSDFALKLLGNAHVAVVPGIAFGASTEGWLRLTFAVAEATLVKGIQRIGEFAHSEYGNTKEI